MMGVAIKEEYTRSPFEKWLSHIWKCYKLRWDDYKNLLEKQNGVCAVCESPDPGGKSGEFFVVDHCHDTGRVRGLLCHKCNVGIGLLGDRPECVAAAVQYLMKHDSRTRRKVWVFQDWTQKQKLGDNAPWLIAWMNNKGRKQTKTIGTKEQAEEQALKMQDVLRAL